MMDLFRAIATASETMQIARGTRNPRAIPDPHAQLKYPIAGAGALLDQGLIELP
jgi:hypothetical protein